ncbi:MAG: Dam-replacing domain protein [Alphaproteobacteria bacterium]|nr:MAG: Dam-replacing domain protein [Alphaproteobacteria bacterium]
MKIDSRIERNTEWLSDVARCIERLEKDIFTLKDVYSFTDELASKHPENNHVKDKIRQQLQILRDRGKLEFLGRGNYRLANRD